MLYPFLCVFLLFLVASLAPFSLLICPCEASSRNDGMWATDCTFIWVPTGSQLWSAFGKQCRLEHRAEMGVLHYLLILFLHITSDPFREVNCEPAFSRLTAGNWPLCSRYVREAWVQSEPEAKWAWPSPYGHAGAPWKQSQSPGCSPRGNETCGTVSLQSQTISQKIPF